MSLHRLWSLITLDETNQTMNKELINNDFFGEIILKI